jgi:hypothetical protein
MRFFKSSQFSFKAVALAFSILLTTGLGSLAIVWLRVEISQAAADSGKLEKEIYDKSRKLRNMTEKRAKALHPVALKTLVDGRLQKPETARVLFVQPDDFQRRQSLPLPKRKSHIYAGSTNR